LITRTYYRRDVSPSLLAVRNLTRKPEKKL